MEGIRLMSFHPMPRYLMRKNALLKLLKNEIKNTDKKELSLLEIGYGAGEIFNLYASLGIRAYGYDFSPKAYETAKQQPAVAAGTVTLYQTKSEIKTRNYDIVVACEVLEHIENDSAALLEWKTYLRSNDSALIISVPAHPERWDNNDIASGHFRRYERTKIIQLLETNGLKIETLYTYDFPSNLILDSLRAYSAKKLVLDKATDIDLEAFTKNSGVERDNNIIFRTLSNPFLLYPLIKFQELFYKKDWGSAYILVAHKSE